MPLVAPLAGDRGGWLGAGLADGLVAEAMRARIAREQPQRGRCQRRPRGERRNRRRQLVGQARELRRDRGEAFLALAWSGAESAVALALFDVPVAAKYAVL